MQELLAPIFSAVILKKDGKLFLLQRSQTARYAPGCYHLIGGRVEVGENFRQAIIREAREEVGISIDLKDLQFKHVFHRSLVEPSLVVVVFECHVWQGEIVNVEPHKHMAMGWFDSNALPEPMVVPHKNILALIDQQIGYSEQ